MQLLLSILGHEVVVAYDGRSGIATARSLKPDVVISDLGLPGDTDGFGVAEAIRAEPSLAGTSLIALSGYGQDEDRRRSSEAGFERHLVKPVDLAALEAALSAVRPFRML
jgi:CheY-like chemotaxis protein